MITIFGICGACQVNDETNVCTQDVKDYDDHFIVNISKTKTKRSLTFTISSNFYHNAKTYQTLKLSKCTTLRFFINHQNGKCTVQNVEKTRLQVPPRSLESTLSWRIVLWGVQKLSHKILQLIVT